jgi:lipopolysaccharide/colanic/teichoic acid biosynthesis glycosyltransferase
MREFQTMKRLFDFIFALIGLIILSPILILISLLILLTMGWPIYYRQTRIGKDQELFKIIKYRSMVKDADRKGPAFTVGGDPRITSVGRFLRKHKLDELPQLLNVFAGKMSIVGPRPEVQKYVEKYDSEQIRVFSVKPGLTDPASIVYRDEEAVLSRYDDVEKAYIERILPAKLKLNLAYIDKATFLTDLGLIFRTLRKLFSSH